MPSGLIFIAAIAAVLLAAFVYGLWHMVLSPAAWQLCSTPYTLLILLSIVLAAVLSIAAAQLRGGSPGAGVLIAVAAIMLVYAVAILAISTNPLYSRVC